MTISLRDGRTVFFSENRVFLEPLVKWFAKVGVETGARDDADRAEPRAATPVHMSTTVRRRYYWLQLGYLMVPPFVIGLVYLAPMIIALLAI